MAENMKIGLALHEAVEKFLSEPENEGPLTLADRSCARCNGREFVRAAGFRAQYKALVCVTCRPVAEGPRGDE